MRHARKLRNGLTLLVVAALVTVALWPEARLVDVGAVERGSVRETLEAEGRTRVRERYELTAPLAASARRLTLRPGDRVEAGQVLVLLDPLPAAALDARARAEAEARVSAAEAQLAAASEATAAAEVLLAQAQAEAARSATLLRERQVAVEEAERAESARRHAEREAAAARFREHSARADLDAARAVLAVGSRAEVGEAVLELRSPVDGVLLQRHFESARPVAAGEVLLEVGDPQDLEVEVDVLSADAVRLAEGLPVELVRWGEEFPLAARVRRIEPGGFTKFSALGVEEQRVWVQLDLAPSSERAVRLGHAYRVHARFVLREVEDVLRVPTSALFRHDGGQAVFRIVEGRARLTPVETGLSGSGRTEVRRGLAQGELLVLHPDRALEDGARVRRR